MASDAGEEKPAECAKWAVEANFWHEQSAVSEFIRDDGEFEGRGGEGGRLVVMRWMGRYSTGWEGEGV